MPSFINIDGELLPTGSGGVRPDNRAMRYGYGLFETMLVRNDIIHLAEYHWERLTTGMAALSIPAGPHFMQVLRAEVLRTVTKAKLEKLCRVRLQVYAGNGGIWGEGFGAGFIIETFPLDEAVLRLNVTGLAIGISSLIKHCSPYAHVKTSAALPYALAAREARDNKWNDAILLNEHGRVADSTIANVFWQKGSNIFTTPLLDGAVAGVMRRHLLKALPRAGFSVFEKSATVDDLKKADGIFLSNAIRGIRWVRSVDDTHFLPHASASIQKLIPLSM